MIMQWLFKSFSYHVHKPDFPRTVQLAELPNVLAEADIVLSAVDSARPVVTPEMSASVADRNVLFVDLGVPRNIDPFYDDWGHGVTVADLDDLKLWHRVKTGVLNEVRTKADVPPLRARPAGRPHASTAKKVRKPPCFCTKESIYYTPTFEQRRKHEH